jgi:hypothetical protein
MDDLLHRGHAVQDVEPWQNNGLFGKITKAKPHGRDRTTPVTKTSKSLALGTAHDLPYHHGFSGEYKFRESNTTLGHDDWPSASLDGSFHSKYSALIPARTSQCNSIPVHTSRKASHASSEAIRIGLNNVF